MSVCQNVHFFAFHGLTFYDSLDYAFGQDKLHKDSLECPNIECANSVLIEGPQKKKKNSPH